jgi:hypothetical protein
MKENQVNLVKSQVWIGLQLGLAAWVAQAYALEANWQVPGLLALAFVGFVFHALVKPPYKILLFALLSQGMLYLVLGLKATLLVTGAGGLLVLILWGIRSSGLRLLLSLVWWLALLGLMLFPPAALAQHRVVVFALSSLFAFRWFWYLKERAREERASLLVDGTYFFNFPAMALWFFPLISYRRWKEAMDRTAAASSLNRGMYWVALGIFQLILYRILEYYGYISSLHVVDADTFWRHIFTNFFLLVRVSGFFHLAMGLLGIFGFSFPKPVDSYFLSSSFSDFWRRVNVYFREFLWEVVLPVLQKNLGIKRVFPSILLLFALSAVLYSWQYFCLHGSFPIKGGDLLFWLVFGLLVSGELAFGKSESKEPSAQSGWITSLVKGGKVSFTFLSMALLWALWATPSLGEWSRMMKQAAVSGQMAWWLYLLLFVGLALLLGLGHKLGMGKLWYGLVDPFADQDGSKIQETTRASAFGRGGLGEWRTWGLLVVFLGIYGLSWENVIEDRTGLSNKYIFPENYFEKMLVSRDLNTFQWKKTPRKFVQFKDTEAAELVEDIRNQIIRPNVQMYFKEQLYTTNRWGMRDRDYAYLPADSVVRVGIAGGSFVVGSGISDEEVFDQILEDQYKALGIKPPAEFLNYSNSGYDLIQCLYHFEQQEHYKMGLDYFVYVSQGVDLHKNIKSILIPYNKGWAQPYDFVEDIILRSGIKRGMEERQQIRLLEPYAQELIEKTYQRMRDVCHAHAIEPVWLYWPTISSFIDQSAYLEALAKSLGMVTLNLEKVFDDVPPDSLTIDQRDRHPNGKAHRMVADALLEIFQTEMPLVKRPYLQKEREGDGNVQ